MISDLKNRVAAWLLGPDVVYVGRGLTVERLSILKSATGHVTVVNYGTLVPKGATNART